MVLIHSGRHLSSHGMVQLLSLQSSFEKQVEYPIPKTGMELAVSAPGGVQVSTEDDTEIEIFVYQGATTLNAFWHHVHSGEIQVGEKGILEVGNFLTCKGMTEVPLEHGTYCVAVYTDTGDLYTVKKVAFVLENIPQ